MMDSTRPPENDAAAALVALAFDFALAQPATRLIEPTSLRAQLTLGLTEEAIAAWISTHLRPSLARAQARAQVTGEAVGANLPDDLKAELLRLAGEPIALKPELLQAVVSQDATRHLLRQVVQDALDRFVTTFQPGGTGGGAVGEVGRLAMGFASKVGRGVLGGLSQQLESQVAKTVKGFVDGSIHLLLERLVHTLSSPETGKALGQSRAAAFAWLLTTPTAELLKLREDPAFSDVLMALPRVLAFNLARAEVQDAVETEVRAWLEIEGARPLSALLPPAALAALRATAIERLSPVAADFLATPELQAWLAAWRGATP